jgi:hypothetical protein
MTLRYYALRNSAKAMDAMTPSIESFCGPNCPFCHAQPPSGDAANVEAWHRTRQYHLLGHLIDWRAGERQDGTSGGISQEGIEAELRYVFNDLTNPELNEARALDASVTSETSPRYRDFGPEKWGCFGLEAQAELMAEAIRAYLQDPNYIKTAAPNVAYRIRQAVNPHPVLSRTIQFN